MDISYSHSFAVRSRCKKCGSLPQFGFKISDKVTAKNVQPFLKLKTLVYQANNIIVNDFYLVEDPRFFDRISYFAAKISFNRADIRIHKYYGLQNKKLTSSFNIGYLCSCQKTMWVLPIEDRKHITNKKSEKFYPIKITPW